MSKFYLVRSEKCYKHAALQNESYGRCSTLEEARKRALDQSATYSKPMLVYEVRLVGRAEMPKAVWYDDEDLVT